MKWIKAGYQDLPPEGTRVIVLCSGFSNDYAEPKIGTIRKYDDDSDLYIDYIGGTIELYSIIRFPEGATVS